MKLVRADHHRRIEIHDVEGLVNRPVDIDQSITGFRDLRSLRIYRFDAGSVIEGDAEQDEVFVVALAGSLELRVRGPHPGHFELSGAGSGGQRGCVVYLPPHHAYSLRSRTATEVAYARATPERPRATRAFMPELTAGSAGLTVVIDEHAYADRLRLRLLRLDTRKGQPDLALCDEWPRASEFILHVRTEPDEGVATAVSPAGASLALRSWDSCAITRDERPVLRISEGATAVALIVAA